MHAVHVFIDLSIPRNWRAAEHTHTKKIEEETKLRFIKRIFVAYSTKPMWNIEKHLILLERHAFLLLLLLDRKLIYKFCEAREKVKQAPPSYVRVHSAMID